MKTLVRIAAVLASAAMALIGLSMGCATVPKVGDGKLEPGTKLAVGAAATAAKIAAPDYAGAIDAAKDKIVNMGETAKAPGTFTKAEVAAIMQAAGYSRVYNVFFDGVVINDTSRFSYREAWEISGTGATVDPVEMFDAVAPEADEPESDLDAEADALLERLAEKKKAK